MHNRTLELGARPATLNYTGFPKSVCTSINDVVCHGIPNQYEILKAGDIINVDVTSIKSGFYGDSSRMYYVGGKEACSEEAIELVEFTKEALMIGINAVKPYARFGDIGYAIKQFVHKSGKKFGIVKEYTGHGIGRAFHEPPQIVHTAKANSGPVIKEGMTFTVEPMINQGTWETQLSKLDGWTVRTKDGKLSAQWEHTIAVTANGFEVLT